MSTNRRQFLARSSALTGAAMAGAFGRFGIESASAQAADYKALVCLFQFGGADSNNMVVPDTDYAQYGLVRTVGSQVGISGSTTVGDELYWDLDGDGYRDPDPEAMEEGIPNITIYLYEDKDGDGNFDERKVFAEKLNLVSGLEVGLITATMENPIKSPHEGSHLPIDPVTSIRSPQQPDRQPQMLKETIRR